MLPKDGKPSPMTPWMDNYYTREHTDAQQSSGPWPYTLVGHVVQCTSNRVECSCWPSLCHCGPPSLASAACGLHSSVITVCLQGTWFYMIFYDLCKTWYMIRRVSLTDCCFIQSTRLPVCHLTGEVDLLSSQSGLGDGAVCSLQIEHPGVCIEPASRKPAVLCNCARLILLYTFIKYMLQLALQYTNFMLK